MVTKFRIHGRDGHRQAQSFGKSETSDFSTEGCKRIIRVLREDITKTNEYVIVEIEKDSLANCLAELSGQLSDGMFEWSHYGDVEIYFNGEWLNIFKFVDAVNAFYY